MGKIKGMEQPAFDGSKMTMSSTFGYNPQSSRRTAPAFGFGACSREQAGKVFVSQEHTALATAGTQSPGPAQYLLPPSVGGKQPDGRKADPPSWAIGKDERFRYEKKGHATPGPGNYKTPPASVGPQVIGRYKTEPLAGFGTAERKHVRKVFISQSHQKTDMHGMDGPGPIYNLKSTLGRQPDSAMRNPPQWGFTTAGRNSASALALAHGTPGPADPLPASVGPQGACTKPGAPTPGFGAATRDTRAALCVSPAPATPPPRRPVPSSARPSARRAPPAPRSPRPRLLPPQSSRPSTRRASSATTRRAPPPTTSCHLRRPAGPLARQKRPPLVLARVALGVVRARDSVEHDARAGQLQRLDAPTGDSCERAV